MGRSGSKTTSQSRASGSRWQGSEGSKTRLEEEYMTQRFRQHRVRGTRIAAAIALAGTMAVASGLAGTGTAGAASAGTAAVAPLVASVHPPGFDNTKEIGLRNALIAALKGKSLSKVDTWMVVNILAAYWVAGKQGDARAAKELGIAAHYEGPSQGQLGDAGVGVRDACLDGRDRLL